MSDEEKKRQRKPRKSLLSTPVDLSVLEKAPPHDLDAERAVLGALLREPELCDDVVIVLRDPDDFYHDAHKRIYSHLMKMRNDDSSIDLLLLVNSLRSSDELELIGGHSYLGEMMSAVPISVHAVHYAEIVKEKATLRKLIHAGSDMVREAYAPETLTKTLLNKAALQMAQLCESQTVNQVTDMGALMQDVNDYMYRKEHGLIDGVKTGFIDLDNMIEGLHPNELVILAARPGMGKTALALNIAEHIAVNDQQTILFVSLEMAKLELALRLICSRAMLDSNKVRRNFLSKDEYNSFTDIASELAKTPMYIDDTPSRTVSEIAAVARRLTREKELKLLVIDYIGLITPENSEIPRQEQVARIARRLKGLARELHIPILCLAQLSRQADLSKNERPRLSHLRESGAIEQDADVVLFIHRKEMTMSQEQSSTEDTHEEAELIVAKQRNGATGDIPLYWKGEYTRFFSKQSRDYHEQVYVEDLGGNAEQVF